MKRRMRWISMLLALCLLLVLPVLAEEVDTAEIAEQAGEVSEPVTDEADEVLFTMPVDEVVEESEAKEIWTDEIAKDVEEAEKAAAEGTATLEKDSVAIDEISFPDETFCAYVAEYFDDNGDGVLSAQECENVTKIELYSNGIGSLAGIEHFPNLTGLYCNDNQLESLDVSHNKALEFLDCGDNQLMSLNVNGCTALTGLYCGDNQLMSLNVSGCTALTDLDCGNNLLTGLDVSHNTALDWLICYDNQLISLDVSHNTALRQLFCEDNQLTNLDVSHNTALLQLHCENNQLTSLDVSYCSDLWDLNCRSDRLVMVDISNCTDLLDVVSEGPEAGSDSQTVCFGGDDFGYLQIHPSTCVFADGNLLYGELPCVISVKVKKSRISMDETSKFTVKTEPRAMYLHILNSRGQELDQWGRDEYSTLSADGQTRVWNVERTPTLSGTKKYTFYASIDKANYGEGEAVKVTVLSTITRVKASNAVVQAWKNVKCTVRTDTGAKFLYLYRAGNLLQTWEEEENSNLTSDGNARVWTVKWKEDRGHKAWKYTFKASYAEDGYKGKGKSVKITAKSAVKSAKLQKATIRVGARAVFTVKTDIGAKYLRLYDRNDGTLLKTWKRSGNAKLSDDGKYLIWTVKQRFNDADTYTLQLKATVDKKKYGASKTVKLHVTD